jgi:hypothetical protein
MLTVKDKGIAPFHFKPDAPQFAFALLAFVDATFVFHAHPDPLMVPRSLVSASVVVHCFTCISTLRA